MLKKPVLVLVAVAAIALGACGKSDNPAVGGSGSTSTSSTAPVATAGGSGATTTGGSGVALTKAAYVNKANAICKSVNDAANKLTPPSADPTKVKSSDLPAWSQFLMKALALGQQEQSQLKGLTPPAADQATISAYLSKLSQVVADVQAIQQAAASGNVNAFKAAFPKSEADGQAADSAAAAYGMSQCGSSSTGNS